MQEAGESRCAFRARGVQSGPRWGRLPREVLVTRPGTIEVRQLAVPWGEPNDMVWSPDAKLLACATDDGAVHVLDAVSGEQVAALGDHDVDEVTALDFGPGGGVIASTDLSSTVYLWSARSGSPLSSMAHEHGGHFLAYLADGRTLVSAGLGQAAALIDVESMQVTGLLKSGAGEMRLTAVSANRKVLGAYTAHDKVLLWDLETREPRPSVRGPEMIHVTCLALSPDGGQLAAGHEDGSLTVWRTDGGELRSRLPAHEGAVRFVAWAPGGAELASSGADQLVRLWRDKDLSARGYRTTPAAPGLLAWTPDGRVLAADAGAGQVVLMPREGDAFAPVAGD